MSELLIREAGEGDLERLLRLYTQLHEKTIPPLDDRIYIPWRRILADPGHHILLGLVDGEAVSSCVLVVIPNLTRGGSPYALVENVVTHADYRGQGYASRLLDAARDMAGEAGCYKIMLLTGAKDDATLNFYRRAGYNSSDKTAFIQWL